MNDNMTIVLYAIPIVLAAYIFIRRQLLAANPNVTNVSAAQAQQMLEENAFKLILDVRTPQEYAMGHIQGAINIPVQTLPQRMNDLIKNADQNILVYCASGSRSPKAVSYLLENKFTKINHLNRGMSTWRGKTNTGKKR